MHQQEFAYLRKEIQVNLHKEKQLWTRQQAVRFLKLLNIHSVLKEHFEALAINGEKLFSPKYGVNYLREHLQSQMNERTYLPIIKLIMIVHWLTEQHNGIWSPGDVQFPYDFQDQSNSVHSMQSKYNSATATIDRPKEKRVDFSGDLIQKLIEQVQLLETLSEKGVANLTCQQLERIMLALKEDKYSKIITEFRIDGFSLLFVVMDEQLFTGMRNYFPEEQLNTMEQLASLLVLMHAREQLKLNNIFNDQPVLITQLHSERTLESQDSASNLITIGMNKQQSNLSLKQLTMEEILKKQSSQSLEKCSQKTHDQLDFDLLIRKSKKEQNRQSQKKSFSSVRYSEYGGVSQLAGSERGSQIYADSVIMDSYMDPSDIPSDNGNKYVSSIEDHQTVKQLKKISPILPFNLLNLQPLRWIRITRLPHATSKDVKDHKEHSNQDLDESELTIKTEPLQEKFSPSKKMKTIEQIQSKIFTLKGAKIGKHKQNDFCYPDESSISRKHAQVYFNAGYFFLQDVGSKTGTFIRIMDPIILNDETCIQLSNEVELTIKILKKEENEGLINIQFNKPENFEGYRISLKSGFSIKVGRSADSHIKIDEKRTKVSQKHAVIKYQDRKFWFIDRKSTGGSWLRLSKKSVVSEGYRLSVDTIFRVSYKKSFLVEEIKQMGEEEQQPMP